MMRNIKINNILDITEISKLMEPNKCINFFNENVYLNVPMIFQSSMGPRKSRCDVLSGITQGWACSLGKWKNNTLPSTFLTWAI
jgi:hypothetical protein